MKGIFYPFKLSRQAKTHPFQYKVLIGLVFTLCVSTFGWSQTNLVPTAAPACTGCSGDPIASQIEQRKMPNYHGVNPERPKTACVGGVEFIPPNDPSGSVWTSFNNDGYGDGRGIVFMVTSNITIQSIGLYHNLTNVNLSYELAQVTQLSGCVTCGQTVLASGTVNVSTSGLEWIDVNISPVMLLAGNMYHIEFSHPSAGNQNFFHNNDNVAWNQGIFQSLEGTQGGGSSNFVVAAFRVNCGGCPDNDNDGVCNDDDNCPNNSNSTQTDTDGDDVGDACDGCPNDANKTSPGFCGCGWPESTVTGLPCYWYQGDMGANCDGSWYYSSGTFYGSATNCYYASPFNQDAISYAGVRMCGNGSITAQVTSINGTGWAGVFMRETLSAGSKKAQLLTNLSGLHRREFRSATNGQSFPQQFPSNNRYWLRIVRSANQFLMYTSPNGANWYLVASQNISMAGCIEIGLLTTHDEQTGTTSASFGNVSVTGTTGVPLSSPELPDFLMIQGPEQHSLNVFPNPTSGELNVDLSSYFGKPVRIEVLNIYGSVMQMQEIEEVQSGVTPLQFDQYKSGIYLLRVISDGVPDAVERVVRY